MRLWKVQGMSYWKWEKVQGLIQIPVTLGRQRGASVCSRRCIHNHLMNWIASTSITFIALIIFSFINPSSPTHINPISYSTMLCCSMFKFGCLNPIHATCLKTVLHTWEVQGIGFSLLLWDSNPQFSGDLDANYIEPGFALLLESTVIT